MVTREEVLLPKLGSGVLNESKFSKHRVPKHEGQDFLNFLTQRVVKPYSRYRHSGVSG